MNLMLVLREDEVELKLAMHLALKTKEDRKVRESTLSVDRTQRLSSSIYLYIVKSFNLDVAKFRINTPTFYLLV